jgi:hypothetical protein
MLLFSRLHLGAFSPLYHRFTPYATHRQDVARRSYPLTVLSELDYGRAIIRYGLVGPGLPFFLDQASV